LRDIDNELRCHILQYDISLEGVQKLRNAGVHTLPDLNYIQSSDVCNMNMSIIDQRKTEKMLDVWHSSHQDRDLVTNSTHMLVSGSRFGGQKTRMLIQASQSLGTTHSVGPVQTPAFPQELDEDTSTWDKTMAVGGFLYELYKRLIFIIPKLIKGVCLTEEKTLWLYSFDLVLLCYFAVKQRYCPGCLYNDLHVLIKGKNLKPLFVSKRTRRFSGTKKLIVGVSAIATVVQVVEAISELYCFFTAETPWHEKPPQDITLTFASVAGVLASALTTLVAMVATVTFCCFGMVAFVRFYLAALIVCLLCQAKSNLRTQQSHLRQGVDQRHILQKVGGFFSSYYSKDSVNRRKVENAEREVEGLSSAGGKKCWGFSIPDLGSNAGTCMYDFWSLIWESLGDSLPGLIWESLPAELRERIISIPQALYKRVCARAPAPEPQGESE
jgi:hypothetical protein